MTNHTTLNIALLGATGGVGGHFLKRALAAGHQVRPLVRDPARLEASPRLAVIKGDATNPDDVAVLIANVDAVVSCVGNAKGALIMERTAGAVLAAAAQHPTPPKSMFVSSIGCGGTSWIVKQLLCLIGGRRGFADYDRADARISEETRVPYVLVRPAALNQKPGTGRYRVFTSDGTFAKPIPRADVAKFLFDALTTDAWNGQGGFQLAGRK